MSAFKSPPEREPKSPTYRVNILVDRVERGYGGEPYFHAEDSFWLDHREFDTFEEARAAAERLVKLT